MSDLKKIVCGTDFSEPSDHAIAQAAALAQSSGAELTIFHAHTLSADDAEARQALTAAIGEQIARVANGAKARVEIRMGIEAPQAALVDYADSWGADLIVVGSRGATGLARLALGSVAESVVRHAGCPILVARPSPSIGPVLAATDLSDPSLAAISAAHAEAARRGARLAVVSCMDFPPPTMGLGFARLVPPPELPDSRAALAKQAEAHVREAMVRLGLEGDVLIDQGRPQATIPNVADQLGAVLVVVGTRGRTGLRRLLLGSVAESVVRHAPCSVLAVRTTYSPSS